ncbi:Hypothetical predicted protein [Olea europaea subsp. europaea]|uniref:Uncharacterized protein n=1 Tax=Olea europaea subsp. europaea TaxID=158383 RepID=A0A8S0ST52_OLEEU|nr:Hypothetical predicted protein [Olea europaea subsp. europaea]
MSSKPIPYDQMKNECEALVTGKQQKMLALRSFKLQQAAGENERKNMVLELVEDIKLKNLMPIQIQNQLSCSQECVPQSFRLSPSSPYYKFLDARNVVYQGKSEWQWRNGVNRNHNGHAEKMHLAGVLCNYSKRAKTSS